LGFSSLLKLKLSVIAWRADAPQQMLGKKQLVSTTGGSRQKNHFPIALKTNPLKRWKCIEESRRCFSDIPTEKPRV
jgi:hypothetical protein